MQSAAVPAGMGLILLYILLRGTTKKAPHPAHLKVEVEFGVEVARELASLAAVVVARRELLEPERGGDGITHILSVSSARMRVIAAQWSLLAAPWPCCFGPSPLATCPPVSAGLVNCKDITSSSR